MSTFAMLYLSALAVIIVDNYMVHMHHRRLHFPLSAPAVRQQLGTTGRSHKHIYTHAAAE